MERTPTDKSRDILQSPWLSFVVWWLPGIAIAVAGNRGFTNGWRTVVWAASLSIMGAACIANAVRCKRLHCYLTGPFFLLMALVTVFFGLGVVTLGASGWTLLSLTILFGGIGLWWLPELIWGKYRKGQAK